MMHNNNQVNSKKQVNAEENEKMQQGRIHYPGQELEGKYGWFGFTPKWLNFCNNPGGFLFSFSLFLLTQGMIVNGVFNVIITTLERRFRLQSFETGLIAVSYDIGYFLVCLFVTFHANRGHRPRLLAIGSLIMGLGTLIFAIPHYTSGLYEYEDGVSVLCDPNKNITCETGDDVENLHGYLYVFIFAMFVQGVGCVPLYTMSYAVLEDSLTKKKSPLYISFGNAMSLLGPVIGYIFGGYLLYIYVDFDSVDASENELSPGDPRWVGAWWVAHLFATVICFSIIPVTMFGFSRQFPGSAKIRAERVSEVHARGGAEITENPEFGRSMRDLPTAALALIKNPTYSFTVLGSCTEAFVISGFTAFLPKVIENQYNTTAGMAALYAGVIAIPGGVFGNVISGIIVSKFNLRTPQLLKILMFCVAAVFFLSPIGLYHCADPTIAGITTPYNYENTTEMDGIQSTCNTNCECQEEYFTPVCGNDGISYFSSCHAGCTDYGYVNETGVYLNCSCISAENHQEATYGKCEEPCNALIPFILVFFVIVLISFTISTPGQLVIMRCVPDSQHSFAVGLQVFFMRALGSIPGPIVFGIIFDLTCVLWQERSCGQGRGSCYVYSSDTLAINLMVTAMCGKAASFVLFYLAYRFYKLPESDTKEIELSFTEKCNGEKENFAFEATEMPTENEISLRVCEEYTVL